jgi:cyclase
MTRRSLVSLILLAGFACGIASGQAKVTPERLAEGVWATATPGGSNVGWFVVGDSVVAVDSGANEEVARALLEEIQKTAGKKPRFLVLTHAHRDHAGGAAVFAAAGVQVISAEKAVSGVVPLLDAGKAGSGSPMVMTIAERSLLLGRGARRAEIYYLGPGHTQGDLIIVLPDVGVLFSGDLAVQGVLPFMRSTDVDPEGWQKILARLTALKIEKMVPGHGAIGPTSGITDTGVYVRRVTEIGRNIAIAGHPEALWEAQIYDPINQIENVRMSPDHTANVKAIAQYEKARMGEAPAAKPAATPAPTSVPTAVPKPGTP